jgi:hypothetical protein
MTLRERIADWISGGALTAMDNARKNWIESYHFVDRKLIGQYKIMSKLNVSLHRIAACETPGANATVRRMARIAREALE